MRTVNVPLTTEQKKILLAALNEYKACNHGPTCDTDLDGYTTEEKKEIRDRYLWLHRVVNDCRRTINRAFKKSKGVNQ